MEHSDMTKYDEMREKIVAEVKTWLHTKWHHEARLKGVGVDCGMLLIEVYANCGLIEHLTPPHYPPDFMMHRSEEWFMQTIMAHAFEVFDSMPGDAILYRHGRIYSHGGIVVKWPQIIHASVPDRCVCYGDADLRPLSVRHHKMFRHNFFKDE
jgi:cell wall-associated NlpC family hydrolase